MTITINGIIYSISFITLLFIIVELAIFMIMLMNTLDGITDKYCSLYVYIYNVRYNLLDCRGYMFPLSSDYKDKLTIVGKIFFMIIWTVFCMIPVILAIVVGFFVWVIIRIIKKILFKDSRGDEDTHDIDH